LSKPILIADDSEDDVTLLKRTLALVGLANPVIVVGDGEEAISYLKGEPPYSDRQKYPLPGVLMVDLKMPRCDGFEVLKWVGARPELSKMLVLVLSGQTEIKSVERAYALGAKTFLMKPCHREDLENLIKTFQGYWTRTDSSSPKEAPAPPLSVNNPFIERDRNADQRVESDPSRNRNAGQQGNQRA
jgi:CheY-like chemotaxis protein